jgi:NTP pyrophosphatase (non-canonical NTP hydrolase)
MLVSWQPKQHKAAMDKQQAEHEKDRDEWEERHRAISDQRIAEIREVMTALNNNTGALNVISQTQSDRTASMERLAAKLGEVVHHVGNLERLNGEHATSLKAANETLNRVVWALGGKGAGLSGPP